MDDELIDLDQLDQHRGGGCDSSRRSFCLGAGAGLLVLAAGCGTEDPRIATGGIDTQPPNGGNTTNGGTTGNGSTTNGGTTGNGSTTNGGTTGNGSTTNGGTTGSTTTGGTTGSSASCASSMTSVGAASAVAVGKAKRVRSGQVDAWLCHDANGYYALDNYCPHRGCTVSFQTSGSFYCGCHGATFDFNGAKTNRVSPSPMDHLLLCVDSSGNAFIDPNQTVDASTRV